MPWAVSVRFDEDKADVGTALAVFTDSDSSVFLFSQRIQASVAGRNAFVSAAMAARTSWQTRKTAEASGVSSIKSRFVTQGETVT